MDSKFRANRPRPIYFGVAILALAIVIAEYVILGGVLPLVIGLFVVIVIAALGFLRGARR